MEYPKGIAELGTCQDYHRMFSSDEFTLRHVLKRSAERYPDRIALSTIDGTPITYASLLEQAQSLSHFLHERGIITGDRVAILGDNDAPWVRDIQSGAQFFDPRGKLVRLDRHKRIRVDAIGQRLNF